MQPILHFVLSAIGTGRITNKKTAQSHHTPSYVYAVYNRQALSLLEQITPYLRTYKRRRSVLILENYIKLTARNGKYSDKLAAKRKEFEDEVMQTKASWNS